VVAKHVPGFDGLRGIAALIVAVNHAPQYGFAQVVERGAGSYGVILFFALSGFLMAHLYFDRAWTPKAVADYVAGRCVRIIPLYFTVLALGVCVAAFTGPDWPFSMSFDVFIKHLLFVGNVSIFWSIGPEFQFYFFFILIWLGVALARQGRSIFMSLLCLFCVGIYFFAGDFPGVIFLSKLHIFLFGIGFAVLRARCDAAQWNRWVALLLQLLAIALLWFILFPPVALKELVYPIVVGDPKFLAYYSDLLKIGVVAFIVFCFSLNSTLTATLFSGAFARFLGNSSFSVYLLHVPVFYFLNKAGVATGLHPIAGFGVALSSVLALSYVSYRLLETPSRERLRRPVAALLLRYHARLFNQPGLAG
jgi:peptidoglycan/LPS O-acetylase OafA/YrhL